VTTVARFLALLELFREQAVAFEQLTPLGELTIRWTGSASGDLEISDEFDAAAEPSTPAASDAAAAGATTDADTEKGPA
jgi:segregation and condensation protein A